MMSALPRAQSSETCLVQSRDADRDKWMLRVSSQEKKMAIQRYVIKAARLLEFSFLFMCLIGAA